MGSYSTNPLFCENCDDFTKHTFVKEYGLISPRGILNPTYKCMVCGKRRKSLLLEEEKKRRTKKTSKRRKMSTISLYCRNCRDNTRHTFYENPFFKCTDCGEKRRLEDEEEKRSRLLNQSEHPPKSWHSGPIGPHLFGENPPKESTPEYIKKAYKERNIRKLYSKLELDDEIERCPECGAIGDEIRTNRPPMIIVNCKLDFPKYTCIKCGYNWGSLL